MTCEENPRPENPFEIDPESYERCNAALRAHLQHTLATDRPSDPETCFDPSVYRREAIVIGPGGIGRVVEVPSPFD